MAGNLKSIVNLSVNEERLKYQLLQSQIVRIFFTMSWDRVVPAVPLGKLDIADQDDCKSDCLLPSYLRTVKTYSLLKMNWKLPGFIWKWKSSVIKIIWTGRSKQKMESKISDAKFTLQPFLENSILHGISSGAHQLFHFDVFFMAMIRLRSPLRTTVPAWT